jgi:hypothetical protein
MLLSGVSVTCQEDGGLVSLERWHIMPRKIEATICPPFDEQCSRHHLSRGEPTVFCAMVSGGYLFYIHNAEVTPHGTRAE